MSRKVPEGWRNIELAEVADECRQRNTEGSLSPDALLGVFKNEGMVPMRDRVRGSDVSRYKLLPPNAFAYNPMRLNIGSIARWTGERHALVSPDYVVFQCDERRLSGDFLDHVRSSKDWANFMENAGKGGVRIRIYFKDLGQFRFLLPPLSEQRRIAEILSSVDEAIAATQAVIEQTRTVKQDVLKRLLTKGIGHTRFKQTEIGEIPQAWELVPLERLLASVPAPMRSGPFGSTLKKSELAEEGVPFLGIDNVHIEHFVSSYRRFVTKEKFEELKRYAVRPRDVMITIMGTIGRCCVVPDNTIPALSSKHVWTMTFDQAKYIPELICWQLNFAPWVLGEFDRVAQGGVMGAINSKTLKALLLPKPPLEEQTRFLGIWQSFNETLRIEKEKLDALVGTKSALMSDLLTGRKRVPMAERAAIQ